MLICVPTQQQRSQERSVLYPLVADTLIVALMAIMAVSTGSLTLIGESLRILLNLLAGYWGLWCLMAVHRGSLGRYEFGTTKMEWFAAALCGLGLLMGGLWLCDAIVSGLFVARQVSSPAGLAIAAVVNAINVLINVLGWIGMLRARQYCASEAFRAQLKVRVVLLVASLGVQLTLTGAALAQDPVFARAFDITGASFVAILMIVNGCRMAARAVPTLLDWAGPHELKAELRDALARLLPEVEVLSVRTRQTGSAHVAEIAIPGHSELSICTLRHRTTGLREEFSRLQRPIEFKIVPVSGGHGTRLAAFGGSDAR